MAFPAWGVGGFGLAILLLIALPCIVTLPWSLQRYDVQNMQVDEHGRRLDPMRPPSAAEPLGSDKLGRSLLWRLLLGGAISLGIGASSAAIAVIIGVTWGAIAGYVGGRVDAIMMRTVDVLYGLPYILLVVLVSIALNPMFDRLALMVFEQRVATQVAPIVTLLVAIGGVSWLTMARVIRGQVLSLRNQPFVEAARACGTGPIRILCSHLLPNLIGPIVVYTTLTVPQAILQESFLSFLGIGVKEPLPSWGNLASEGLESLQAFLATGRRGPEMGLSAGGLGNGQTNFQSGWWLLWWPCLALGLTLMSLNFLGDALRARLDPRRMKT